jgi:hypothetical protein
MVYIYAPDRKSGRPTAHLANFKGTLQVDGYGDRVLARRNAVQLAFCWAHVRRRFYEPAQTCPAPIASESLSAAHRRTLQYGKPRSAAIFRTSDGQCVRKRAKPIMAAPEAWLRGKLEQISQEQAGEAIQYARSTKPPRRVPAVGLRI